MIILLSFIITLDNWVLLDFFLFFFLKIKINSSTLETYIERTIFINYLKKRS